MDTKKLYPLKFIPIPSEKPWGGSALIAKLGKTFTVADEDGNESELTSNDKIGESWEIADMGFNDSVVSQGWLAGNTIGELMETYMERIVGDDLYNYYGRQFPLLVKFLDIQDRLSVQVHPDDVTAAERYDSLGKSEVWYILDAEPDAKIYLGFNRNINAGELYERCLSGTVEEVLNVIHPQKGDVIHITPGTVHAADKGILIAEIQESSDLTFRLYDWGREHNPQTARPIHLEEAMDFINYDKFDDSLYIKAAESQNNGEPVRCLVKSDEFTISLMNVDSPLLIETDKFNRFLIYSCIEGSAQIKKSLKEADSEDVILKKGETILIPADMDNFYIVPLSAGTQLIESMVERREEMDEYIDPDTEPFLEGEDYGGLETMNDPEDEED